VPRMPRAVGSAAQRQPITTTLRNILKDYPASTCLRELLQNADDAGATEIVSPSDQVSNLILLMTSRNLCSIRLPMNVIRPG